MLASERSFVPARWLRAVLVVVALLLAAHLVDWWAHANLQAPRLAEKDLGRMLRVMGFLPFWIVVALALALCDRAHQAGGAALRHARAWLLVGGAALGGLVAEVLKLTVRRERPNLEVGAYVFREWSERPFHTGGLGLASSHAGVAFGAAFMLARLFPRARWVWYGLAVGCAYSRIAAGVHFVSDVVVAGMLAFAVVAILWRRWGHLASPTGAEATPVLTLPHGGATELQPAMARSASAHGRSQGLYARPTQDITVRSQPVRE
jgi:membrane-associated phospholipid phosphatase